MNPEQEIDEAVLVKIIDALGAREEVPPRLLWSALTWSLRELNRRDDDIQSVIRIATEIKLRNAR